MDMNLVYALLENWIRVGEEPESVMMVITNGSKRVYT